ncbi:peptidase M15 [Putridiphycobacter roseus]|uniref:D-alanyl-D-alanine dipeptidase n=2 Tax=Putridiphycobacter roseus TaxID=2219161 RepID=A0A2W1MXP0_9FLAO|nr:peptidase M15 [Putridiphycobacter roseus]
MAIINAGLVDIQSLDTTILVSLKYATTDNFMQKNVYGSLKKAYLQKEVAESLVIAQNYLKSIDSSLTLFIYDAVRPRSVQQYMWDYLEMPIAKKVKFVSNPKNGSIHNYGSAVDLTIASINGEALDMGAKYDEIEQIAYPRLEKQFLASGKLTTTQVENRKLLRKVMKHANFTGISTEWWHFNRYSRTVAKSKYKIIE